jgi:hypothetical protein
MLHLILKLSTPYSCPICEWLIVVVDSIHSIFLKWIVDQNWIGNLNLFHLSFLHCFSASAWCNRATVQPCNRTTTCRHLQALGPWPLRGVGGNVMKEQFALRRPETKESQQIQVRAVRVAVMGLDGTLWLEWSEVKRWNITGERWTDG